MELSLRSTQDSVIIMGFQIMFFNSELDFYAYYTEGANRSKYSIFNLIITTFSLWFLKKSFDSFDVHYSTLTNEV